ncbi:RusA family crossover junction endodeoxyribonuclease [Salinicoccus sp. ID82-1]|uniref:RusA family crossover junction endodeoxyribonuclease n=1 Tax=Salinicoccus sp. ID82-1 TaxID=2820269 RepID=UPI001F3313AB|nr:RusA family crossover junction endodeoxyribonuclease [Salinicoccus sp. ID82-1]MCG1009240.1 RusA family crossover junction endodeoxyribonuclease [Salinicoccus sp. ID82-1]
MIEFKVEGKPVPQPRPRVYQTKEGKSKAVNSRQSVTYKRLVKLTAKSNMNKQRLTIAECPIAVHLTFVFTPPKSYTKKKLKAIQEGALRYQKKPDLDNLAKGILDALNQTVYKDDSQIVELNVKKQYGDTDHVLIQVKEMI